MAIKTDGSLWVWGHSDYGRDEDNVNDRKLPVKILDNVVSVTSAFGVGLIIKQDETLWAWGYNREGELEMEPPQRGISLLKLWIMFPLSK